MKHEEFLRVWRKAQTPTAKACPVAEEFKAKLNDVIFKPLEKTILNRLKIMQAKHLLQEEFHTWRKSAGPEHQTCLYEAYEEAYDKLNLMELTHRPTTNIILDYDQLSKPAPPQPAQPVIKGIIIGHDMDAD